MEANTQGFFEKISTALSQAAPVIAIVSGIISIALIVLFFILIRKQDRLKSRLDYFLRGSKRETLEATLRHVVDDNRQMKQQVKANNESIERINENLITAYRKIGVVKFNAFPGMAGKMSSSVALLNNENNGIIINCIHGQEGCYTYVKEIMNGKSVNPLTKEDEEALKIALQMQI